MVAPRLQVFESAWLMPRLPGMMAAGCSDRSAPAGVWPVRLRAWPDASLRGLLQLRGTAVSASQYELSEQAMCLVIWPGREDQLVGFGGVPVAETQAPQAFDGDRVAVGPA